jgi:anti-sigma regulatory factor (Ser/Thr protein kinase)
VSHTVTIPLAADAARQTRRSFDRYSGTVEEALLDDLRLLSSEMVTNAVQHSGCSAGDPILVEVTRTRETVRVEVTDRGERKEPVRPRSQVPASGLQFVEVLSDRWSSGADDSFHVWFEIEINADGLIRRKQPPPT